MQPDRRTDWRQAGSRAALSEGFIPSIKWEDFG